MNLRLNTSKLYYVFFFSYEADKINQICLQLV